MIRAFSFLQRNPDSGILYFRFTIPEKYRKAIGRREIKISLKTADKRLAVPLAMQHYVNIQDKFLKLDRGKMKKNEANFIQKITADEIDVVSGKARNIEINYGGDSEKELKALYAVQEMLSKGIGTPVPPPVGNPQCDSIKLADMFKRFRAEKLCSNACTPKTIRENEALHDLAIQILGNMETGLISCREGRKIKETLLQLPANAGKKYPGMTVKKILAVNNLKERMNLATVNFKIQRLSSAFAWAIPHGYVTLNPFDGLQIREKRGDREQRKGSRLKI